MNLKNKKKFEVHDCNEFEANDCDEFRQIKGNIEFWMSMK